MTSLKMAAGPREFQRWPLVHRNDDDELSLVEIQDGRGPAQDGGSNPIWSLSTGKVGRKRKNTKICVCILSFLKLVSFLYDY